MGMIDSSSVKFASGGGRGRSTQATAKNPILKPFKIHANRIRTYAVWHHAIVRPHAVPLALHIDGGDRIVAAAVGVGMLELLSRRTLVAEESPVWHWPAMSRIVSEQ